VSKWKKVRLGDVCDTNIATLSSKTDFIIDYIDISSVDNEKKEIISYKTYSSDEAPSRAKLLIKKHDVLVSTVRPNLNAVALVSTETSNRMVASTGFCILRSNDLLDCNYLFHYTKSNTFIRKLMSVAKGASYPAVSNSDVYGTLIPLPPLDIQKQIARELDTVSELLKLRKQQLEELDQLTKSVFYEMFGDPVRNEKGWEVKKVESICINIFGGGTPSKKVKEYYEGDIPWVTPKDMKSYWITDSEDHINELAITISSTRLVPSRSLLMVVRSGILKHTLPVAINLREVAINQDLKAFVFRDDVSVIYMLYLFKMIEKFLLKGVRSVTADNIEFNSIKGLSVPVPPTYEQSKFADIVTQIESQKALVKKAIDETQLLFDSLMSKYFDD